MSVTTDCSPARLVGRVRGSEVRAMSDHRGFSGSGHNVHGLPHCLEGKQARAPAGEPGP